MNDFAMWLPDLSWMGAIVYRIKFVLAIAFYALLLTGTTLYNLHVDYSAKAAPYRAIASKYIREKAIASVGAMDDWACEVLA